MLPVFAFAAGCGDSSRQSHDASNPDAFEIIDSETASQEVGLLPTDASPSQFDASRPDISGSTVDGGLGPDAGTDSKQAPSTATIIVLPDTQYYTYSADAGFYQPPDHAGVFDEQIAWILAQKAALNINAVLHVGDLVDSPSDPGQWNIAGTAMHRLDGIVPYVIVPGNHDEDNKSRQGLIDSYFGPASMPWITGTKVVGQMENNYALVDIGGRQWLVVALEFSPTDAYVTWADQVLKAFPDRPAILLTHAFSTAMVRGTTSRLPEATRVMTVTNGGTHSSTRSLPAKA